MQEKTSGIANYLGDRLRRWRKSIPMKSFELAKLIQISQGSLSDIENNKSLPSADTLAKLYLKTDINIIWLLVGVGPMARKSPEHGGGEALVYEETAEYGQDAKLKELIERLIRIYHRGDPVKRAHILGFLIGADPGSRE
jgi:transcriptional regulator with XRE-family HTH domain